MTEPTNAQRAEWGVLGLQAFTNRVFHGEGDRDLTNQDAFEQALSDMLGDLMHYVKQQGWGEGEEPLEMIQRLAVRGHMHFKDEANDEYLEWLEQPCTTTWSDGWGEHRCHTNNHSPTMRHRCRCDAVHGDPVRGE